MNPLARCVLKLTAETLQTSTKYQKHVKEFRKNENTPRITIEYNWFLLLSVRNSVFNHSLNTLGLAAGWVKWYLDIPPPLIPRIRWYGEGIFGFYQARQRLFITVMWLIEKVPLWQKLILHILQSLYYPPIQYLFKTNRGQVTHICVVDLTIIGSDNDSSPGRRQAII